MGARLRDAQRSILDDLGEEVTSILTPVSICMALTVMLVKTLNPTGASDARSVFIASAFYSEKVSMMDQAAMLRPKCVKIVVCECDHWFACTGHRFNIHKDIWRPDQCNNIRGHCHADDLPTGVPLQARGAFGALLTVQLLSARV